MLDECSRAAMETVELPAGVRHHNTTVFAESWEAYHDLTGEDGWSEKVRFDSQTGRPVRWKNGEIRGHQITVHAPHGVTA